MMQEIIAFAALYVVEAIIADVYLDYLFARKRKIWLHVLSFCVVYAILFGISRLNMTTLNAISFSLLNFILIVFLYHCGIKTAIVHSALLCFYVMFAEILVSLAITLFGYSFSEYTNNFAIMLTLIVWSKLLYMVLTMIGARIFAPHKQKNDEPGAMLLFCVLPIGSAVVTAAIIYIGMVDDVSAPGALIIAIAVTALLLMNLLFLGIYNHLQKVNQENTALQLAIQRDQADAAHYQMLQEQFDNQRILVHDIKNHLRTIDILAKQGKADQIADYILKIDESLSSASQKRLTGDPILNIMLLRFQKECQEVHIKFSCDIREGCLLFMDAIDITTLFGNLLTNAQEAAADSKERQIDLSVRRNIGQASVVITLDNTCDRLPETDGEGNFVTSKKDKIRHGVGLKSIRRVVRKYGGMESLRYDAESQRFCHIIHFPDRE